MKSRLFCLFLMLTVALLAGCGSSTETKVSGVSNVATLQAAMADFPNGVNGEW